ATPDGTGEVVARLSPPRQPPATAAAQQKPLAVGDELPDWSVAGWTDGVDRNLSDFRGKVVVIDVWGVWCSACLHGIPALKDVEQRFRDRDVVFLGLHTAGTELGQIRNVMQFKKWGWPTALDAGDDITMGTTVERYRVRSF